MFCNLNYLKECDGCLKCKNNPLPNKRQSRRRRKAFLAIQKRRKEKERGRMVGK